MKITRPTTRNTKGLTLIELVVAMAVFALVAIMGLQSLTGSVRMRDRLVDISSQTDQLSLGLARLRNDLSGALPMVFFPPDQPRPSSALRSTGTGFQLSIGNQPALNATAGGRDALPKGRVIWQFKEREGQLTRTAWPTLWPVVASQQGAEVVVLEGITGIGFRSFWEGEGWVQGLVPPQGSNRAQNSGGADEDSVGVATENYSSSLPYAMEVTLETAQYGPITLVEYFQ